MLKFIASVAVIVCLVSGVAFAGISATPHNLSATNATGEICLPCHAPHGGSTTGYLWNHTFKADSAFTKFEDDFVLGDSTLKCLGCHDGQTSVDDYFGSTSGSMGPLTGRKALGLDLTTTHPVGVEYPTSSTSMAAVTITATGSHRIMIGTKYLRLSETNGKYQVECSTCHTPHSNDNGGFLRMSNAGSAMCLGCHVSK